MNQYWIKRIYENCSGCRKCEIACSIHHENLFWPEASRIRVFMLVPGIEIPHLCFQCEDYPCVENCPTEALSVDSQTMSVIVDEEKCTACETCIEIMLLLGGPDVFWKANIDDKNPGRFWEPLPSGPFKGKQLDKDEFKNDIQRYYNLVGWDENGIPTPEILKKLDIEDVELKLETIK